MKNGVQIMTFSCYKINFCHKNQETSPHVCIRS
jgi:hypothetical protein